MADDGHCGAGTIFRPKVRQSHLPVSLLSSPQSAIQMLKASNQINGNIQIVQLFGLLIKQQQSALPFTSCGNIIIQLMAITLRQLSQLLQPFTITTVFAYFPFPKQNF